MTDVTHPQAGDLLLTRQHVGVLGFTTQTVMETRHEQRICRIVVGKDSCPLPDGTDVLLSAVCQVPYVEELSDQGMTGSTGSGSTGSSPPDRE